MAEAAPLVEEEVVRSPVMEEPAVGAETPEARPGAAVAVRRMAPVDLAGLEERTGRCLEEPPEEKRGEGATGSCRTAWRLGEPTAVAVAAGCI